MNQMVGLCWISSCQGLSTWRPRKENARKSSINFH